MFFQNTSQVNTLNTFFNDPEMAGFRVSGGVGYGKPLNGIYVPHKRVIYILVY